MKLSMKRINQTRGGAQWWSLRVNKILAKSVKNWVQIAKILAKFQKNGQNAEILGKNAKKKSVSICPKIQ